jgi:hypothetical protein
VNDDVEPDESDIVVATRRLVVRRFAFSDAPAFHGYRNDPEVARYQGRSPTRRTTPTRSPS